ncbi:MULTISPECIES: CoA ester lyase [unclassified Undibacterium]|uniref:HpcH/HpaI aldolase/citrate lyase family protein n=1 Tax=unclassified Undibacterium TaxID=2630295 RepID=UPI002AC9007E|nr:MULTISPECIES: CoA ester lyase [unclassified Undibacterium]MEB0140493.1 CoA ester lyase [Undibacterium sp. CCC2.1]MEB0174162.1 CoA ester lyase [Undibacterium sp. CCC1.1]MEB0178097.1 CoA ester lyase [Undibacterium sp. CCC3.4]MEB0217312.1 CoA ester lyase [Undibacterium sp. 5I2]WPX44623.1 CoA ester lyase [Undibacterium sp. CCC3.4]
MTTLTPRSFLYCSALNESQFCKSTNTDVTVIDLEDGVAKERKAEARAIVSGFYRCPVSACTALRINSIYHPEGLKDILLVNALPHKPNYVVMAMVESAAEIDIVRQNLSDSAIRLLVTVETPACMRVIYDVAAVSDGLIFGSADYAASLGVAIGGWTNILHARSQIVAAASYAGIPAFDTAYFKLGDEQGLAEECKQVMQLGFAGKTAIHPNQIDTINAAFTPTKAEIAHAEAVLATVESSGNNITKLDRMMIGPPFVKLAQKILARRRALEQKQGVL